MGLLMLKSKNYKIFCKNIRQYYRNIITFGGNNPDYKRSF